MSGQQVFLPCYTELRDARKSNRVERMDQAIALTEQHRKNGEFTGVNARLIDAGMRSLRRARKKLLRSIAQQEVATAEK